MWLAEQERASSPGPRTGGKTPVFLLSPPPAVLILCWLLASDFAFGHFVLTKTLALACGHALLSPFPGLLESSKVPETLWVLKRERLVSRVF